MNFIGIINHNEDKIPMYQLRGTTSPFIEVDFDVTTPAAMQNSILQKRASNDKNAETIQEFGGLIPVVGSVWSNPDAADNDGITVDMVGTIVSGIKFKEPQKPNETTNGRNSRKGC